MTIYQQVLSAAPVPVSQLAGWSFNFPASNIDYVGLFPRSWTTYTIPGKAITLVCRQVSPIFPNDYKVIKLKF